MGCPPGLGACATPRGHRQSCARFGVSIFCRRFCVAAAHARKKRTTKQSKPAIDSLKFTAPMRWTSSTSSSVEWLRNRHLSEGLLPIGCVDLSGAFEDPVEHPTIGGISLSDLMTSHRSGIENQPQEAPRRCRFVAANGPSARNLSHQHALWIHW